MEQQTSNAGRTLRIASANLLYGGLSPDGDRGRLLKTIDVLREWDADCILLQEVTARVEPALQTSLWDVPKERRDTRLHEMEISSEAKAQEHLRKIAASLDMTPVLGPPMPMSFSRNHPAILIRGGRGYEITHAGPPCAPAGGLHPAWCQVGVRIPGLPSPLALYSAHLPARSATMQRLQAEWLACLIAQRGELTVVSGDWNCFARTDGTSDELETMPLHLRPPRMLQVNGELRPNYAVDDTLTAVGLIDAAAHLPAEQREPHGLVATATHGKRIDRFYVTPELADALRAYEQRDTGGSDHQAMLLTLDAGAVAAAEPPGPVP